MKRTQDERFNDSLFFVSADNVGRLVGRELRQGLLVEIVLSFNISGGVFSFTIIGEHAQVVLFEVQRIEGNTKLIEIF